MLFEVVDTGTDAVIAGMDVWTVILGIFKGKDSLVAIVIEGSMVTVPARHGAVFDDEVRKVDGTDIAVEFFQFIG